MIAWVASVRSNPAAWRHSLPLAFGGLLVAGFHTLLYLGVLPERIEPCSNEASCTNAAMTILGGVPLPLLALAAFVAIALLLRKTHSRTFA